MTSAIYCGKLVNKENDLFVPVYHRAEGLSMETGLLADSDDRREVLGVKKCRAYSSLARVLSIAVLLCFALGLLFALSHHCGGEDCPLCLLNERGKEKLWIFTACVFLLLWGDYFRDIIYNKNHRDSLTGESPVEQKVKLSN